METTARNRTIGGIVIGAIILILLLVLFSCTVNSDSDPESSPKKDPTTGESSTPGEQDTIEPEDKPSESESADEESDANDDDIVPAANTGVSFIPAGNVPSGSTPTCELDPSACEGKRPPGAGVDICEIRPDLDQCQPPEPPATDPPATDPPGEGDDDNGSPVCDLFPDLPLCDDDGGEEPGEPGEEDETAPKPVTLTDCNVLTNTSAKVDWSKAHDKSGISHYTVTSTPNAGDPGDTGKTSATFNGLDAGDTYTFSVTATDNEGNESEDSNVIDCVMDVTAPEVPAGVTVEAGDPSDSTLDISWTESEDNEDGVDGVTYNLYRDGKLVGPVNDTEFEDTGLKAGTEYTYTVTAIDEAGNESEPSVEASGTTTKIAPTVPQNVKAENPSIGGFDLSWNGSTDQDGATPDNEIEYIVEVHGGLLGGILCTKTVTGDTSTYVNCLLSEDATVTVTARDGDGNESAPSDPAPVTAKAKRQANNPSLRSNTPGKDKSDAPTDKLTEEPSEEPTEEKSPLLPSLGDALGGDKDAEEESVTPESTESESVAPKPTTEEKSAEEEAEEKDAPADEEKKDDEGGILDGIVGGLTAAVAAVF